MHVYLRVVGAGRSESHVTCSRRAVGWKMLRLLCAETFKAGFVQNERSPTREESQSAELPSLIYRGRCVGHRLPLLVDSRLAAPPKGGRNFGTPV